MSNPASTTDIRFSAPRRPARRLQGSAGADAFDPVAHRVRVHARSRTHADETARAGADSRGQGRVRGVLVRRGASRELLDEAAEDLGVTVDEKFMASPMPIYIFEMRDQAEDWLEYGLFSFFADRQGAYMGYEWVGCSYEPLARIAERVHKEELGHAAFGYRLIRRYLQREGDRGRELLIKHLAKWYPAGLDMFGKSGSKRQFDYVRWGLRRRSNEQMRDEFTEEVNNLLTKLEIPIPDPRSRPPFQLGDEIEKVESRRSAEARRAHQARIARDRARRSLRRQYRSHFAGGGRRLRREKLRPRVDSRHRGARANFLPAHLLLPPQQGGTSLPDFAARVRAVGRARGITDVGDRRSRRAPASFHPQPSRVPHEQPRRDEGAGARGRFADRPLRCRHHAAQARVLAHLPPAARRLTPRIATRRSIASRRASSLRCCSAR